MESFTYYNIYIYTHTHSLIDAIIFSLRTTQSAPFRSPNRALSALVLYYYSALLLSLYFYTMAWLMLMLLLAWRVVTRVCLGQLGEVLVVSRYVKRQINEFVRNFININTVTFRPMRLASAVVAVFCFCFLFSSCPLKIVLCQHFLQRLFSH